MIYVNGSKNSQNMLIRLYIIQKLNIQTASKIQKTSLLKTRSDPNKLTNIVNTTRIIQLMKSNSTDSFYLIQIRKEYMDSVNSPFLGEIYALKTKSRNIRKRIYKYLLAHQHQTHPKINKKIKSLVPEMSLPQPISMQLQEVELYSLSNLENMTFQTGIDCRQMKKMVSKQEGDVASITSFSTLVYKTAQKRKPFSEIKTRHQTETQKALMFTTENEDSGNLSLQGDFCSDISIFKGIDDIQQPKYSEDLEPIKLKENVSMFQLEHRCSNIIISSSMFDDPMQADILNFI